MGTKQELANILLQILPYAEAVKPLIADLQFLSNLDEIKVKADREFEFLKTREQKAKAAVEEQVQKLNETNAILVKAESRAQELAQEARAKAVASANEVVEQARAMKREIDGQVVAQRQVLSEVNEQIEEATNRRDSILSEIDQLKRKIA